MKSMKSAFSLVELSIVLVILGLLTGGILAGQSLIEAAQMRKTATQIGKLNAAVNSFRDKYFCLPGDCASISSFGLTVPAACTGSMNGNGNGNIEFLLSGESGNFGCLLASVQMIEGLELDKGYQKTKYALPPAITSIGTDGYQAYWWPSSFPTTTNASVPTGSHYYWLTSTNNMIARPSVLSVERTEILDMKLDDGQPRAGFIMATGTSAVYNGTTIVPLFNAATDATAAAGSTNPQCVTNTLEYNLLNTNQSVCSITVKAGF